MYKIFIVISILIFVHSNKSNLLDIDKNPIVKIEHGKVMGSVLETRLKTKFYAFRGIPYAKPPIGHLRFQPPQSPKRWSNILDAKEDAPICPQLYKKPPNSTVKITINESCLFINVYVKQGNLRNSTLKPVLVFVHDGAFKFGSGSSVHSAGPRYLMDRDIVLVSFNYRIGLLGFMALNNSKVPGNAGMKDQVLALKWIQNNIHNFGGNKNLVTAFGNSAGGVSIMMHLVSPMSVGLFHRAIIISPAYMPHIEPSTHNLELTKKQAKLLGCTDVEQGEDIVNCLQNVSVGRISNSLTAMFEFSDTPVVLFEPVVELDFGQERFLIESPTTSFIKEKFHHMPVMLSITEDELTGPAIKIVENKNDLHALCTDFNRFSPIFCMYERKTPRSFEISDALWHAYNFTHLVDKSQLPNLVKLFSDSGIGFGVHRFAQIVNKYTDVFLFKFSYQGKYSTVHYPGNKPYGVSHTDELLYFLAREEAAPIFLESDVESKKIEQMIRLFTHFAISGNPTNKDDDVVGKVNWQPHTYQNHFYLDIGNQLVLMKNLREERYLVWEKLFPLENDNTID